MRSGIFWILFNSQGTSYAQLSENSEKHYKLSLLKNACNFLTIYPEIRVERNYFNLLLENNTDKNQKC